MGLSLIGRLQHILHMAISPAAFACSFLIEGYGTHDDARGRPLNHVGQREGPRIIMHRCSLFSLRRY